MFRILQFARLIKYRVFKLFSPRIDKENFGGIHNYNLAESSSILAEAIKKAQPFSLMRMGFAELDLFYEYEKKLNDKSYKYKDSKMALTFDNDDMLIEKYCTLLIDAYKNVDMIANWYSCVQEGQAIQKYANHAIGMTARVVEPYYSIPYWTEALKGKKVLVITPFDSTVRAQYERKDKIWPNGLLPTFELKTIKSVWYVGEAGKDERFHSWFEALDFLKKEIESVDFDIALLGCGPFGVPLVTHIKSLGKQGIYIGGALQIIFGIKGERWDNNKYFQNMYNEYWVRPGEEDKPINPEKLDGGCYW